MAAKGRTSLFMSVPMAPLRPCDSRGPHRARPRRFSIFVEFAAKIRHCLQGCHIPVGRKNCWQRENLSREAAWRSTGTSNRAPQREGIHIIPIKRNNRPWLTSGEPETAKTAREPRTASRHPVRTVLQVRGSYTSRQQYLVGSRSIEAPHIATRYVRT